MNFVFRVDSSSEIGHGHLMRCLVLAKELRSRGALVQFISREHTGSANDRVTSEGFRLHLLPGKKIVTKSASYKDWLGCSQAEDANACNQILTRLMKCHLIVDHYGIDIEWESKIRCERLTVIDDLADRYHQCGGIIEQSLVHTKADYKVLVGKDFEFCGGGNILLRDEFRKTSAWKDPKNGSLLICMGGADPQGVTNRIIKTLRAWLEKPLDPQPIKKINVVVGPAFEYYQELENYLSGLPVATDIHRDVRNISALMASSSLSILSCGTMILEACALGTPAIGIPLADNQKETATFLADRNAILLLPNGNTLEQRLIKHVSHALTDQESLSALSQRSKKMVDRYATEKIAEALINGQ